MFALAIGSALVPALVALGGPRAALIVTGGLLCAITVTAGAAVHAVDGGETANVRTSPPGGGGGVREFAPGGSVTRAG